MAADTLQSFQTVDSLSQEDQEICQKGNQPSDASSGEKTIPQMFYEAVEQFPDRWAISMDGKRMTYAQLNKKSNQVAHMLMQHGSEKGQFIAVFMERSIETVISILAVLKTGGVYIPIHPEYPEERIRYILADSQASYLLTTVSRVDQAMFLADEHRQKILPIDFVLDKYPDSDVSVHLQSSDLAYAIYSSGFTGRPKGTLFTHQGVINLGDWMRTTADASDGLRVLQESPVVHSLKNQYYLLGKSRVVFLTGATGFFGSHLLYELLKQTDAHIYCLVRPSGDIQQRLMKTIHFYFGDMGVKLSRGRVTAIAGDLAQKGLGLADGDRQLLIESMDTIIHAAADVRDCSDTDYVRLVNVAGTKELLEFARRKKGVRFHHVSTVAIPEQLALAGQWEHFLQHGDFRFDTRLENVYADSKLQAEHLVREAIKDGLAAAIYRPGNLVGHSVTGKFRQKFDGNPFYRMLKVMLRLGIAPDVKMCVDLTPVDYASEALIALAFQNNTIGGTFHLVNPEQITFAELVDFLKELGYHITMLKPEDYQEWLLTEGVEMDEETAQLAMAQLEGDGVKDSPYKFGCARTVEALSGAAVRCARPDKRLVYLLLAYAIEVGCFPASDSWVRVADRLNKEMTTV